MELDPGERTSERSIPLNCQMRSSDLALEGKHARYTVCSLKATLLTG